ncbi:Hypothetical protein SMAX5B_003199 [Scophthalmus maximus]|uniref:Uncharacterized protein n=1 Tax=Scophthalmus maximus TaxID=52904 RepID=A0A2U9BDF2_SCOMX|nr:Hypothetical protein SMAX5B_003199 [Scophthalmus maximus]
MTASTPTPSKSRVFPQLPWRMAIAVPQERQPLWMGTQLAVSVHKVIHPASILEAQELPLLAVFSICCLTLTLTFWFNLALNDRPFSVFNMQTVLVNHGIERLPIVQRQKVRDDYLALSQGVKEGVYVFQGLTKVMLS